MEWLPGVDKWYEHTKEGYHVSLAMNDQERIYTAHGPKLWDENYSKYIGLNILKSRCKSSGEAKQVCEDDFKRRQGTDNDGTYRLPKHGAPAPVQKSREETQTSQDEIEGTAGAAA